MKKILGTTLLTLVVLASFSCTAKKTVDSNANPLSDLRVREAIAYAIDMDSIVATIFEGKALVADALVPNGPWKATGLNSRSYDPEKAKTLLKEAKWDPDYTLDVVFYYGDQQTVDLMAVIQSYLQAVGMKMDFNRAEGDLGTILWSLPADPVQGPSSVKWDLAYGAIAALSMHEYFGRFTTGGSTNSHTPGDPEIDRLFTATQASADPAEQQQAFHALEKYFDSVLPVYPLYYQQLFIFESDRVNRNHNNYGNAQFNYDWNIENWTINPDDTGNKRLYSINGPTEFFEAPWLNPGVFPYQKLLFERVILADASLTPTQKGGLAENYTVSSDNQTVTFNFRQGLTWHDGSALRPSDLKWSIEYALKVPVLNSVFSNTFQAIEGAQAFIDGSQDTISGISIAGNSITLQFSKLDPNMLVTFSQFAPLPQKFFEDSNPTEFQQNPYWQNPVGSGPFRIGEVQMNDFTLLVPFDNYHAGRAKIDEILLTPGGENAENIVQSAAAKRLDYGFTKNVADVKALEKMEHITVTPVDIPYTRVLYYNKFPKGE